MDAFLAYCKLHVATKKITTKHCNVTTYYSAVSHSCITKTVITKLYSLHGYCNSIGHVIT